MAVNPNHIAGIYNYCDRWCERCTFTSKCAVYAREQTNTPEENDINNKAFWEKITKSFENIAKQINEIANREGVDLSKMIVKKWMIMKPCKK